MRHFLFASCRLLISVSDSADAERRRATGRCTVSLTLSSSQPLASSSRLPSAALCSPLRGCWLFVLDCGLLVLRKCHQAAGRNLLLALCRNSISEAPWLGPTAKPTASPRAGGEWAGREDRGEAGASLREGVPGPHVGTSQCKLDRGTGGGCSLPSPTFPSLSFHPHRRQKSHGGSSCSTASPGRGRPQPWGAR